MYISNRLKAVTLILTIVGTIAFHPGVEAAKHIDCSRYDKQINYHNCHGMLKECAEFDSTREWFAKKCRAYNRGELTDLQMGGAAQIYDKAIGELRKAAVSKGYR